MLEVKMRWRIGFGTLAAAAAAGSVFNLAAPKLAPGSVKDASRSREMCCSLCHCETSGAAQNPLQVLGLGCSAGRQTCRAANIGPPPCARELLVV